MSFQATSAQRGLKSLTLAIGIDMNSTLLADVDSGADTWTKIAPPIPETETSTWTWTPNPLQMEPGDANWWKYHLQNTYCPPANILSRHFALFQS